MKNNRDKGRVTDKWIEDNYDTQKERTFKKVTKYSTFDESGILSVTDFFNRMISKLDVAENVRVSASGKVEFGRIENRPESYEDVIKRLKDKEIAKRKQDAQNRKEYKEYQRLKEKFESPKRVKNPKWEKIQIAFSVPASEIK